MNPRLEVTGVILAGGLGRRMSHDGQGVDKGLQTFRGRPLVAHALDRLGPQVAALIVNANQHRDVYESFGHPVVPDAIGGFAGPLAGLAAAMQYATTPWVATVPCDSPLFPLDLIEKLAQAVQVAQSQVAVVQTADRQQPVFLLAHTSLLPGLQAFLSAGQRKIDRWYSALSPAIALYPDDSAFRNINTLDELRALE